MGSRVAIIGGGIAGLAAAEAIERRGRERGRAPEVTVLEAARIPGGKIGTRLESGFTVETGPHGFLDKEPLMKALIERLNLTPKLLKADEAAGKRYIVRGGELQLVPMKPPQFLTSRILPFGARLRVAAEPFVPQRPKGGREESVFDFAARRIGPVAAEWMIDALVTGIYGGDPRRLSAAAAFPRLLEIEEKYGSLIRGQIRMAKEARAKGEAGPGAGGPRGDMLSFERGLGELIDALAARAKVLLGFTVERLARVDGGGFRIEGSGGTVEADAVVLAVPAYDAARLLRPFAEEETRVLDEIRFAKVTVVVQGFDRSALTKPVDGFGFLCPEVERRKILGSIWASTVFPPHAPNGVVMLRTLLGGIRHPELVEGTDAELAARARAELAALIGLSKDKAPVYETVIRWDRAIPQYELGHLERVAAADAIERRVPGVVLGGNSLRGVALIQCVADAERIAAKTLERIGLAQSTQLAHSGA